MTTEPEDKTGAEGPPEDSAAEPDRPALALPFDPVAFAQEVLGRPSIDSGPLSPEGARKPTPAGLGRAPMPTVTDPGELEDARRRSLDSTPSPPHRRTPHGLLSFANARFPSNLPVSSDRAGAPEPDDRDGEELPTRPPPPMQQALIDAMNRSDAPPSTRHAPDVSAAAAASSMAVRSVLLVPASAQEMNDRVSLGDYSGALDIAERLLAIKSDDEPAKACVKNCRAVLRQMYIARIGPLERVPIVMVARDQLRWLSIDHRAGFVLSLVDGVSTLEMLLDVSGMPELDALRILSELAQQRIVSFR